MNVLHKLRELFASRICDLSFRRTHNMSNDREKAGCEAQNGRLARRV